MLGSPYSSQESNNRYLRSLIDQRNASAGINDRFSAMSEYADTPSVYSRAHFSPNTPDGGGYHEGYMYASPMPTSPQFERDQRFDQQSSMLDLDDDRRTSYTPSEAYEDDDVVEEDDSVTTGRMSYLGPKMRFHSRAPWEMEGNALEEEEEPEDGHRPFPLGFPFSRGNGTKSSTSGSSSPRPSTSRPSMESSRSQVSSKRSFETINSQVSYPQGALYALAQESMSTTSLGRPRQKETLRNKFSLGRLRSEVPAGSLPPSPISSPIRTPIRNRFAPSSPSEDHYPHRSGPRKPYDHSRPENDIIHPYANPDLVVYAPEDTAESSFNSTNYHPSRSDSNITITESLSADSMARASAWSSLSSDSSTSSVPSKQRTSSINAKSISSPVSVIGTIRQHDGLIQDRHLPTTSLLPTGATSLPGWTDRNAAPTFSLISLDEARAQRMWNSTTSNVSRGTILTTSMGTPFPPGDNENLNTSSVAESTASTSTTVTSRARARSISAGAKAKNALQTIVGAPKIERRESEPAIAAQPATGAPGGKSIKHKRSGFMRLFNAGKIQERDGEESPPPIPSLPDNPVQYQPIQRTPKPSGHRIPVPSLSPSLLQSTGMHSGDLIFSESSSLGKNVANIRRIPPTLSINTAPQGANTRVSTSAVLDSYQGKPSMPGRPWLNDQQPQSAPPNVTEFPALKLRPVSTLFSAQFAEHIVTGESRSSEETSDLETPRSPSPICLTPGSYTRSSNDQPQIASAPDGQSGIKSLQEQMGSAKQAWQRHIWELEGQVRDLKAEVEELKVKNGNDEYCDKCKRGKAEPLKLAPVSGGIMHRPRARTGTSSRFGSALP